MKKLIISLIVIIAIAACAYIGYNIVISKVFDAVVMPEIAKFEKKENLSEDEKKLLENIEKVAEKHNPQNSEETGGKTPETPTESEKPKLPAIGMSQFVPVSTPAPVIPKATKTPDGSASGASEEKPTTIAHADKKRAIQIVTSVIPAGELSRLAALAAKDFSAAKSEYKKYYNALSKSQRDELWALYNKYKHLL